MKKKLITLMLTLAIAVTSLSVFVGCKKEDTLKIWAGSNMIDTKAYDTMVSNFQKLHPEIKVKIEIKNVNEDVTLENLTDLQAGADLFVMPSDQMDVFNQRNYLYEIPASVGDNTHFKQDIIDRNTDTSVVPAKLGDKLMAFPVNESNTYFMFYNKQIFPQGMPTTMQGIIDALKAYNNAPNIQIQSGNRQVFHYPLGNSWYNTAFLRADGVIIDDTLTPKTNLDTAKGDSKYGYGAIDNLFMLGSNQDKGLDILENNVTNAYYAGGVGDDADREYKQIMGVQGGNVSRIAAVVGGAWMNDDITKAWGENNVGLAELPSVDINGTQSQLVPFTGGKYMGVNALSKFPGEALLLADYITSEEGQLIRYDAINDVPSNKAALQHDKVKNDPISAIIARQNELGTIMMNIPGKLWDNGDPFFSLFREAGNTVQGQVYDKNYIKTQLTRLASGINNGTGWGAN